ncbi:mesoderm posterior protein 1 [Mustela lutreola]|uniref:Mesoderm posterior protein 1 n=1 Tax=Mustela putorius furo TaxID=9669 RepID=A0A8U0RFF1_MUSPF|nr:mesoderm posterior protein 1 [Mustela putorius furo]XP_059035563.1 mesoderm posterior protein 1 [Mustela lutreola]
MAQSLCPPLSESWLLSPGWGPARPPPPSDRDCGCSPASSPDSWGSVPAGSPEPSPGQPGTHAGPRARSAGRRGARGSRLGSGQRQSASEREKLRMRTLARALHELRRFLPPSVAPAGQSLTKIETLRLAIRYIGHLSAVLGLSEESLQQQRRRRRRSDAATPRGCPLCPDGGPAQAQTQVQAQVAARAPALGSAATWGSSPACPVALGAPEPRDPPVLYDKAACPESQTMELDPSSPLFPGDVLALLETWMPLSPLEWPPA